MVLDFSVVDSLERVFFVGLGCGKGGFTAEIRSDVEISHFALEGLVELRVGSVLGGFHWEKGVGCLNLKIFFGIFLKFRFFDFFMKFSIFRFFSKFAIFRKKRKIGSNCKLFKI